MPIPSPPVASYAAKPLPAFGSHFYPLLPIQTFAPGCAAMRSLPDPPFPLLPMHSATCRALRFGCLHPATANPHQFSSVHSSSMQSTRLPPIPCYAPHPYPLHCQSTPPQCYPCRPILPFPHPPYQRHPPTSADPGRSLPVRFKPIPNCLSGPLPSRALQSITATPRPSIAMPPCPMLPILTMPLLRSARQSRPVHNCHSDAPTPQRVGPFLSQPAHPRPSEPALHIPIVCCQSCRVHSVASQSFPWLPKLPLLALRFLCGAQRSIP